MNYWISAIAGVAILGLIVTGLEFDKKESELRLRMERQQGRIEGLQMQLKHQPSVSVTQTNETNGVKIK
jgi:hypothetical protein